MQPEENKATVLRWYEDLFNEGNLELADEILTPQHAHHDPVLPHIPPGPEDQRQLFSLYRDAFPDAKVAVEEQLAEGDDVVTRWSAASARQGELTGVPPTDNRVEISGITRSRVSGSKFEEEWNNFDQLGVLRQLGVVQGR